MESGLEALRAELRKNAERQARELEAEGERQAKEIIGQAYEQAKQLLAAAEEEAKALAHEEQGRVSAARLKAGQIVAEAREQGISLALKGLMKELSQSAGAKGASREEYEKLFLKLGKRALREIEGGAVRCRKSDAPLAKKLGGLGEPIDCAGGLVVESPDGRIRLDASFESLAEEHRDELSRKAFELLYEK